MLQFLLVGIGGFFGSMARYGLAQVLLPSGVSESFPVGTFSVNLIGCLIIGLLAGFAEHTPLMTPTVRLLLFTGVLGGFTTFSAFGLETVQLLRDEQMRVAVLYSIGSVTLGLSLVWCGIGGGLWIGALFFGKAL